MAGTRVSGDLSVFGVFSWAFQLGLLGCAGWAYFVLFGFLDFVLICGYMGFSLLGSLCWICLHWG